MSPEPPAISAPALPPPASDLHCHRCGYDLRAQSPDAVCPECGTSVAESVRVAAVPVRPRWRDADPRWRRRVFAGLGVLLLLLPVLAWLDRSGYTRRIPVWSPLNSDASPCTLADTFLMQNFVYPPLLLCIGLLLLLTPERGRRVTRVDRLRPWGVLFVVGVATLALADLLVWVGFTLTGVTSIFHTLPFAHEPASTPLIRAAGIGLLRYGPSVDVRTDLASAVLACLAVIVVSVVLHDALRSTLPTPHVPLADLTPRERRHRHLTFVWPALLAVLAVTHLAQATVQLQRVGLRPLPRWAVYAGDADQYRLYFRPDIPARYLDHRAHFTSDFRREMSVEVVKLGALGGTVIALSVASLRAARERRGRVRK